MRTPVRIPAAVRAAFAAAILLLAPTVRPAAAQTSATADSGLLVIYDGMTPVAHEKFRYQLAGDSILVTSSARRQVLDDQKQKHLFEKNMLLVVDSRDLGLRRYLSTQSFRGRDVVRGLIVTDTVFTYYTEDSGYGDATRIAQPPGRLFVFDSALFTLFDVITRSLAGKEFETRRMQLVEMAPDSLLLPTATVTMVRPDTLTWAGRRIPARRYLLDDDGVRFDLWADLQGRMLRALHEGSGLRVERDLDTLPGAAPAARARRTPAKR